MTSAGATDVARLQAAFRSDAGRIRSNNEDVPLVDADRGVFGVIDGVGGHAAGELAAAIACDVILQRLARPLGTPAERVREAIAIANNEIFARAQAAPDLHGMTCVVTLALVSESTVTVGHVGDTRLYALGPAGLVKVTRDHSPVGEREDAGDLSESEAMRHPRRNEVFRDVGSAYRDKDEDDYVEVVEIPFSRQGAILLCSDGLTDMVPAATIDRVVRQFAGNPTAVVDALVAAANDAGGRDNVTVVYAEAPDFARAYRGRSGPLPPAAASTVSPSAGGDSPVSPLVVRAARAIVRSRTTWFVAGLSMGLLTAAGLVWRPPAWLPAAAPWMPETSRTLSVGGDGALAYASLTTALQHARAGDIVEIEPGTYSERVLLPEGVTLAARVPGSVRLVRAAGQTGDWVAVTSAGGGTRLAGVRIESTAELPVDVGVHAAGNGLAVEGLEFSGVMRAGIELTAGASASIRGTQFAVGGPALTVGDGAAAHVTGNTFLRTARSSGPPLHLGAATDTTLRHNVFAGFGTDIVKGYSAGERQQIAAANVIVGADVSAK